MNRLNNLLKYLGFLDFHGQAKEEERVISRITEMITLNWIFSLSGCIVHAVKSRSREVKTLLEVIQQVEELGLRMSQFHHRACAHNYIVH